MIVNVRICGLEKTAMRKIFVCLKILAKAVVVFKMDRTWAVFVYKDIQVVTARFMIIVSIHLVDSMVRV